MSQNFLDDFIKRVAEEGLTVYGICVRQHNREIASHRWRSDDRVNLFSVSKAFTSVAVGIAQDEGLLCLDDKVAPLFEDKLPSSPDPRVFDLTIRHLLTMSDGREEGYLSFNYAFPCIADCTAHYFSRPFTFAPGESFAYNNGAPYILSAIITRKTGQSMRDYLIPRLFDVLKIGNPQWFACPNGINMGGCDLHLTTEEVSRFSQMVLDGGVYDGRRIVSEAYLKEASVPQATYVNENADFDRYGYYFWINSAHHAFSATGLYDQFGLVLPEKDAAIAITSHTEGDRCGKIIPIIWETIEPKL